MLKSALLLFAVIVIVNILASELRVITNDLLNTFFWAAIVSLVVGYFGFGNREVIA